MDPDAPSFLCLFNSEIRISSIPSAIEGRKSRSAELGSLNDGEKTSPIPGSSVVNRSCVGRLDLSDCHRLSMAPKEKDIWTREEDRRFFRILNEYRNAGNHTSHDWKKVEGIYNSQSDKAKTVLQLRNHYANCQGKFKTWLAMSKMTGIALTNDGLPTAEELGSERMKAFLQANKAHGGYVTRNKLVDLDLWAPVFQRNLATGEHSMTPALAKAQTNRSTGKEVVDDQLEGSGDSDDINGPTNLSPFVSEPARSRSPPKTNSSKKRKLSEIDKAFKLLKRTEQNSPEDQLIEAVSNLEEVKSRGELFIAKCIKYLVKEGLDKLFPKLRSDAQKLSWLVNVE